MSEAGPRGASPAPTAGSRRIPDPLLAAAERWPDRVALVAGGEAISYRTLAASARSVALALRRRGVEPGDRVALLAADTAEAVVVIHAVRLAGAVLVPLPRRSPPPELEGLLGRVRPALLVHDASTAAVARALGAGALGSGQLVASAEVAALWGSSARGGAIARDDLPGTLDPEAPAAVLFTSGTTGLPRPAVLVGRNLLASAEAWNGFLAPRPEDVWLATLPLSHVAGLGILVRATLAGLPVVLHERFDPAAVLDALVRAKVSYLSLVPTQLGRLLELADSIGWRAGIEASALRALLLGGAPIDPDLVRRAVASGFPVVPTYGLTEAASGVTALPAAEAANHPEAAGWALPGIRVRVVGDDGGQAAAGEVGEILVAGPTVFAGYDGDPEATARALRDDWLHTGDLGVLDGAGRLVVVERSIDRIVSGGENVSPTEVEAVLGAHPDVVEAVVVGHPDREWGTVPVAAVTLRPGAALAGAPDEAVEATLQAFARERLASFKVPKRIVRVEAIPRTASGKVRRPTVAELIAAASLPSAGPAGNPSSPPPSPSPVDGPRSGDAGSSRRPSVIEIVRPDGAVIAVRRLGAGPPLLLLHATLSTAADYDPLAALLAESFTVLAVDRRSAGASREPPPRREPPGAVTTTGAAATAEEPGAVPAHPAVPGPIDVAVHVADLVGVLTEVGIVPSPEAEVEGRPFEGAPRTTGRGRGAIVVGHSFGAVVGLELAARRPDLVAGVWAFEPPYVPVAPRALRRLLAGLAEQLRAIALRDGLEAAGPAFLAAVAGLDPGRLSDRARRAAEAEARSALADAALLGLDPERLRGVTARVALVLGERSQPWYRAIAAGLAAILERAEVTTLPDLDHAGPLRDPELVARAIRDWVAGWRAIP